MGAVAKRAALRKPKAGAKGAARTAKPRAAAKKSVRPPEKPKKTAVELIKWSQVEDTLFDLCVKTIKMFAKAHAEEVFYALFIDFAADWTRIRLHLNTPALLRQRAEEYVRSNPELYARRSVEAVANDIRWEPGDFGYFDVNNSRGWRQNWTPFAERLTKAAAKQDAMTYALGDFVELRFLLTVSRVLLRLEAEGALEPLARTRNFRVCCMRPEERPEDAWRRLSLLRRQMAEEKPPSGGSAGRR
jgi:hypothetical protein